MKHYRITFSMLIMLLSLSFAQAQEVWGLQKCVDYALDKNISIEQAEVNVGFSEINQRQAFHNRLPSLSGSSGVSWNFGRSIDPTSNEFNTETFVSNNFSLNSGILLFNGFRLKNTLKQSEIDLIASKKDKSQIERDITLSVASAFLNVLFAEENLQIANNQLALTMEQYNQVDKLIQAGSRPGNDILDIEAQIALDEQNLVTFENNLQIAMLNLKQLLRLDPDYNMILDRPGGLQVETDPDMLTFGEVYKSALMAQPSIEAGDLRVQSAEMGVKIAKAGLLPSLSAGANIGTNYSNFGQRIDGFERVKIEQDIEINGQDQTIGIYQNVPLNSKNPYLDQLDQNLAYGVGFQLSVPIYNNYANQLNVERAKLNVVNASSQMEQAKDNLKVTVQQSLADARASKKKLTAAQKSLSAQRASFNNAQRRFDLGAINTFEFVNIRNALASAEINALIAKYEYLFNSKVIDYYMGKRITLD